MARTVLDLKLIPGNGIKTGPGELIVTHFFFFWSKPEHIIKKRRIWSKINNKRKKAFMANVKDTFMCIVIPEKYAVTL